MEYKKTHLLGKGGFGTVWRGINKETNEKVLIKEIIAEKGNEKMKDKIYRSIHIPNILHSKYVPKTLDVIYFEEEANEQQIWIISEYKEGISLDKADIDNVLILFLKLAFIFSEFHKKIYVIEI